MRRQDKKQNILESNLRLESAFITKKQQSYHYEFLTEEEKSSIEEMVKNSKNGVIIESDINYIEELNYNLGFYNNFKQNINEGTGVFSTILKIIGNIKDILSGVGWVKKLVDRFKEWFLKKLPKSSEKVVNGINNIKTFVEWFKKALSPKGIAWLMAAIKNRTFKPTEEQKSNEMVMAKKIWKGILSSLVIAFVIKMSMIFGPQIITLLKHPETLATILGGVGLKALFTKIISSISAYQKHKELNKLKLELESENKHVEEELFGLEKAYSQGKSTHDEEYYGDIKFK